MKNSEIKAGTWIDSKGYGRVFIAYVFAEDNPYLSGYCIATTKPERYEGVSPLWIDRVAESNNEIARISYL